MLWPHGIVDHSAMLYALEAPLWTIDLDSHKDLWPRPY